MAPVSESKIHYRCGPIALLLMLPRDTQHQAREEHEKVLPQEKGIRHHEGEGEEGNQRSRVGYSVSGRSPQFGVIVGLYRLHLRPGGASPGKGFRDLVFVAWVVCVFICQNGCLVFSRAFSSGTSPGQWTDLTHHCTY